MARPLRIEFPGAFYHVMNRGNTGMDIFRSERDREKFLEYVGKAVKRYEIIAELDPKITELTRVYGVFIYPIGQFG
jgi:hypothetical protein